MENNDTLTQIIKERDMFYKRGIELSQKKFQSDETDEICPAFVKAQSEFGPVTKNSKGYNYTYASLEVVIAMVRPIFGKNGLSFSQFTDEHNVLYTRIRHLSGQWFESRVKLKDQPEGDTKRSAEQAYGSSQTYMRRYQACAILGIQPEGEDTDARRSL